MLLAGMMNCRIQSLSFDLVLGKSISKKQVEQGLYIVKGGDSDLLECMSEKVGGWSYTMGVKSIKSFKSKDFMGPFVHR